MSPLLSNILLDVLDKELQRKGLRFVRYADDFSIYAKSQAAAKKLGNEVYIFLKEKLDLPINRAKSGIRIPNTFELLGHGFTPNYKKEGRTLRKDLVDLFSDEPGRGKGGKYQLVVKQGQA